MGCHETDRTEPLRRDKPGDEATTPSRKGEQKKNREAPDFMLEDEVSRLGVHSNGRLVQEEDARPVDEASGNVETALHPTRKSLYSLSCAVSQSHEH